jgi:hypothetical protein
VRWFGLVGIAADEAGELNTGTFLDLFRVVLGPAENLVLGPIDAWATDGDLIVPEDSQRNGYNQGYMHHLRHSHSDPLPNYVETSSSTMAAHARQLLTSTPDFASLSQFSDQQGLISEGNNVAQMYRLTNPPTENNNP